MMMTVKGRRQNRGRSPFFVFPVLLFVFFLTGAVHVYAHGVAADYAKVSGIEIAAAYDNGQPLAGGQVIVYAPDNPATPWMRSVLDDQGKFGFIPDHDITGTWSVQVRQTGHGAMIHIPISSEGIEQSDAASGRLGNGQKAVIAVCVVWGGIGTALFFSRRKKEKSGFVKPPAASDL
ncbi:MAG: carboxypeptidase regulatory-like domain-containing protein [Thermodesulfobacteriota bacterium]